MGFDPLSCAMLSRWGWDVCGSYGWTGLTGFWCCRPTHSHGHIGHYLRSMRVSGRRAQAKQAADSAQGAPGEMSVGDLLASLLRVRLASMDADERWIKDEDV